jgi:hypothetical protein
MNSRAPRFANDSARIILGVTGVHNQRPLRLGTERYLCRKCRALRFTGRIVVMVVETAFADGDSTAVDQLAESRDVTRRVKASCVVGVYSGGREDEPRILSRACGGDRRRIERFPDTDDRQSARIAGASDYLAAVAGERRVREVGVAVDED